MRIGIVSPYAWDVPGGVQANIKDHATYLLREGHHVSVLFFIPVLIIET